MSALIWTADGFVEDRLGEAAGAVLMSPDEATGKLGSGTASVLVLQPGDEPAAVASRLDEFDAVFGGWMCSDGHRANIMLPDWVELGTGVVGT